MKKTSLVLAALTLIVVMLVAGCGSAATSTAKAAAPAGTTTAAATTTSPAANTQTATPTMNANQTAVASSIEGPMPPAGTPVSGGTLRFITNTFPKDLGYPPEMSPGDTEIDQLALESLVRWDQHGNLIGVLATSWEGDPTNKTITWHLRHGVTFSDGTPWNAAAAKWNFDFELKNGLITDGSKITSVEATDNYTIVLHLSDYNNMMFENYGWGFFISPTAFQTAGGTIPANSDLTKEESWARTHPVGTGPFMVTNFQTDTSVTFVKNPHYWRTGMPYYDGIVVTYISDAMTAMAKMQAGEADMWFGGTVQNAQQLQKSGFNVNWGAGFGYIIAFSSSDPTSTFHDLRVREAVEYAINRPALAATIGAGTYEPMTELAGKNFPAYIPNFDPRPYNVQQAKDLLTQAGYPNGFTTTLMCMQPNTPAADIIQADLAAVGIKVNIDIADPGRYASSLFANGWKDMALAAYGINPDSTDLFVHFGATPMTFKTGDIWKSQTYLNDCNTAEHIYTADALKAAEQTIVRQASADAMVVPLYISSNPIVMAKYVHTSYPLIHLVEWNAYQDWMDSH